MLEKDASHCLFGLVVKFVRLEEKEKRKRAHLLASSPGCMIKEKGSAIWCERVWCCESSGVAISIVRRNCTAVCGLWVEDRPHELSHRRGQGERPRHFVRFPCGDFDVRRLPGSKKVVYEHKAEVRHKGRVFCSFYLSPCLFL